MSVELQYIAELAKLAEGIDIIMGANTDRLYVPIEQLPVVDCETGGTVGRFTFDWETEKVVFRTADE